MKHVIEAPFLFGYGMELAKGDVDDDLSLTRL